MCESWLAELEERGGRRCGEVDLPDLTTFCGFESFDMKEEPWTGQKWGISEV